MVSSIDAIKVAKVAVDAQPGVGVLWHNRYRNKVSKLKHLEGQHKDLKDEHKDLKDDHKDFIFFVI